MKTILLMVVFLLVTACQSNRIFTGERCQTFFAFDAAKQIILDESVCRCTNYKISMNLIGNINGEVTRHPIEYCHEKLGYSVKDNLRLTNFYKDVRDDIQSQNQKNLSEAPSENY